MGRIKKPKAVPSRLQPKVEVEGSTDHLTPAFAFTHAADSGECTIYECGDLPSVLECFKRMEARTWQQIKATTGKKEKTGLGFTVLAENQLPNKGRALGEDVRDRVFEVRVDHRSRIMGFRDGRVCNVVWYDPDHRITG